MSSVHETQEEKSHGNPAVFRYDYPEAVVGEWAVFWEITDEELFFEANGLPDNPTDVADDAWIAMTEKSVVSLDGMR